MNIAPRQDIHQWSVDSSITFEGRVVVTAVCTRCGTVRVHRVLQAPSSINLAGTCPGITLDDPLPGP